MPARPLPRLRPTNSKLCPPFPLPLSPTPRAAPIDHNNHRAIFCPRAKFFQMTEASPLRMAPMSRLLIPPWNKIRRTTDKCGCRNTIPLYENGVQRCRTVCQKRLLRHLLILMQTLHRLRSGERRAGHMEISYNYTLLLFQCSMRN